MPQRVIILGAAGLTSSTNQRHALQAIGTPTLAEGLPHGADAKSVKPAL